MKGRASKTSLALVFSFVLVSVIAVSQGQYASLQCVEATDKSDLVQQCTGSGTLAMAGQDSFTLDIFALDGYSEYEAFEVDIDIRLTSVTGNVDLTVTSPSGNVFSSHRNVGNDIVYINRHEIESGEYVLAVSGIGATSNYVITAYITQERLLNPMEQLILGQVMLDCCNTAPGSCAALKQKYPTFNDNDNSTNPNFCYIHGNVCSRDGRIQEFSMPNNSMTCTFPASAFRSLPKLERIDLANNRLRGNISQIAEILSAAPQLQFIDFSSNNLTGKLDQTCGFSKTSLIQQLGLSNNSLAGSIPQCLLGQKALWEFHVDNNALSGPIPNIPNAKSSKLVRFTGANQRGPGFNGSLPAGIADLSRLAYIDFSGNSLTGDLPRMPSTIRRLNLAKNQLTNSGQSTALPPTYGALPILQTLNLQGNQLSGDLPAEITKIGSLKYLDVSCNQITSALPTQWAALQNLNLLKVDNNQLTGTVPGSLASLPNLNQLDLSSNQFSGTLDDYNTNMLNSQAGTVYRYFNASDNEIIGPLNDVHSLGSLGLFSPQALTVSSSGNSGSQAPLVLDLSGNAFTGVWPSWLFYAIVNAQAHVTVNLSGSSLVCPPAAWVTEHPYDQSRLAGQTCQTTSQDGTYQQIALNQVVISPTLHKGLSGGAVFGIILAVFIAVGALAYIGWYWYQQRQRQKAINAASFSSNVGGFGNYPARTGASGNYSTFSDDQGWSNPNNALLSSSPTRAQDKKKLVGLASVPLSQKGEF